MPRFPVLHHLPEFAQTHVHELVILSWHLFLCHPLLLLLSIFYSIGVFSILCGQNTGASASASVLPINIQDWFPLGLTGLISLLSKGLSRVFSSTTVRKPQFFGAQPSLWSMTTFVHDYWGNHSSSYMNLARLAKWCLCFLICCLGLS